jgi:hypothetical protein
MGSRSGGRRSKSDRRPSGEEEEAPTTLESQQQQLHVDVPATGNRDKSAGGCRWRHVALLIAVGLSRGRTEVNDHREEGGFDSGGANTYRRPISLGWNVRVEVSPSHASPPQPPLRMPYCPQIHPPRAASNRASNKHTLRRFLEAR